MVAYLEVSGGVVLRPSGSFAFGCVVGRLRARWDTDELPVVVDGFRARSWVSD